jgi:hypothetical protein
MLMRFHNSRAIVKQDTQANKPSPTMNMLPLRMTHIQPARKQPTNNKISNAIHDVQKPDAPKMRWGEPIWFLFHTLAEKIKEEHFQSKKYELIELVRNICANLPCPKCCDHATAYMKRLNLSSIKTKRDWKDFLYKFHNEVNQRKNFPEFPHEELDGKYKEANTVNVINYFIAIYKEKSGSVQMIATEMTRMRVLRATQQWLIANLSCFDT